MSNQNNNKRANKSSNIPVDYNPTPPVAPLRPGYERPPAQTFVSNQHVEACKLQCTLITDEISKQSTLQRKYRFLIGKVVSVSGEFWVKEKDTSLWCITKRSEAKSRLCSDWLGKQTKFNICHETINDFFTKNEYEVMEQVICVPGAPDFVKFNGKRCLNIGCAPQMAYRPESVESHGFQVLMELIDQNLLNNAPRSVLSIYDDIEASVGSLTKWFFHWLASIYQRPGYHIGTAIWLIGSQQGVGKTMFTSVLEEIVGPGNATTVNQSELKNDWNDFIGGTQLALADEVKLDSKRDFYDMIKRIIGNPVIALRRRNVGQYVVPNITNWIFTTNASRPVTIDPADRRNTFIATTENVEARKLASQFALLSAADRRDGIEGLAAVLATINIDEQFISTSFHTPLRAQMSEMSERPFQTWLKSTDVEGFWPLNTWMHGEKVRKRFIRWAEDNGVFQGERSLTSINQQLEEAKKLAWIKDARAGKQAAEVTGVAQNARGFVRLQGNDPDLELDECNDIPQAKRHTPSPQLQKIRDSAKRRKEMSSV